MARSIDLNADMGEYADENAAQVEADLMALITSCSVACGGHAGDKESMGRTVRLAKSHTVRIGAHPAYPDREGFGRRSMDIDIDALGISLRKQIDDLRAVLGSENAVLSHVKAHGALYNDTARDERLAGVVAEAAAGASIVGPPGSALEKAARAAGAEFIAEGFVDRLYRTDGSLTPRSLAGAVIADIDARAAQAAAIASGSEFSAADGPMTLNAATLCIHSDSPSAVETARAVRKALDAAGVSIAAFSAGRP